jgi:hypothetical protein
LSKLTVGLVQHTVCVFSEVGSEPPYAEPRTPPTLSRETPYAGERRVYPSYYLSLLLILLLCISREQHG